MAAENYRATLVAHAPRFDSLRARIRAARSCQRGVHHSTDIRHACQ